MRLRTPGAIGGALALAGCMGNGTSDFTSLSDIDDNGRTVIAGQAVAAPFSGALESGSSTAGPAGAVTDASLEIELEDGAVVSIKLEADGRRIIDSQIADGDRIEFRDGFVFALNPGAEFPGTPGDDNLLTVIDPGVDGYEYQLFGVWVEGFFSDSGTLGAITTGAGTPASNVPRSGNAVYSGDSVGWAALASGESGTVEADVTLTTADFQQFLFETENSLFGPTSGGPNQSRTDLDLTGTLDIGGAGFSGAVASTATSGTAQGRFYGPGAEEAGGLFATDGPGGAFYSGAFGARR